MVVGGLSERQHYSVTLPQKSCHAFLCFRSSIIIIIAIAIMTIIIKIITNITIAIIIIVIIIKIIITPQTSPA